MHTHTHARAYSITNTNIQYTHTHPDSASPHNRVAFTVLIPDLRSKVHGTCSTRHITVLSEHSSLIPQPQPLTQLL